MYKLGPRRPVCSFDPFSIFGGPKFHSCQSSSYTRSYTSNNTEALPTMTMSLALLSVLYRCQNALVEKQSHTRAREQGSGFRGLCFSCQGIWATQPPVPANPTSAPPLPPFRFRHTKARAELHARMLAGTLWSEPLHLAPTLHIPSPFPCLYKVLLTLLLLHEGIWRLLRGRQSISIRKLKLQ